MLPPSPPPPTCCFPGLHPHPTMAPRVFTTWNDRGLGWGALWQGVGDIGQVPPRGVPQDNTTSTRKVANQAEMGTSFQGPYIQTLHDQQGRGVPDGTDMGMWWAGGSAQEQYRKTRPPPHSHPHPHPTFGNKSPSGSPWWSGVSSGSSQGGGLPSSALLQCWNGGILSPPWSATRETMR